MGKGGRGNVVPHRKHSSLLITGDGTTIQDCKIIVRSFGHGIYLQEDAADVLIENCEVRGQVRQTSEMLAERGTLAHEKNFRTTIQNREGTNRILPGYTKSLAEDAFRTYGNHPRLIIRDCKAIQMRGGFEVRSKEPALLENCSAIGCERGFWVADGTWLKNCSGDTRFGPLLYTEGEGVTVELTLLPDSSSSVIHSIAAIHDKNHTITIKTNQRRQRIPAQPILVGFSSPSAGENMSRNGENNAHNITLHNETTMPVVIGRKAQDCTIQSNGKILQNKGRDIKLL